VAQTEHHGTGGDERRLRAMPTISDYFRMGEMAERLGRYWWALLVSGIAWIVVTAIVFRFDYASVVAVAVLFGVLAITIGAAELMLAVASRGGWRFLRGLLGAIFVATGIVAFFTPGDTFVGLAAVISFYFVFAGTWDVISSLAARRFAGWWIQLVSGLIELGLGFWAAGSWRISATVLVAFVGAMTLIRGVTQIAVAFALNSTREDAQSTMT
jgi:uncharacterized membrane protein HdeD (DUF308 family)